jgi:hypothetical protein
LFSRFVSGHDFGVDDVLFLWIGLHVRGVATDMLAGEVELSEVSWPTPKEVDSKCFKCAVLKCPVEFWRVFFWSKLSQKP